MLTHSERWLLLCWSPKTPNRNNLETDMINSASAITRGQGQNSRQEPRDRNWSRGQNSRQERRGQEEWCLLVYTFWLLLTFSQFSYATQDNLPRGSTTHSGLCPSTSISHQERAHGHAHRPIRWRWLLTWGLFFPGVPCWQPGLA